MIHVTQDEANWPVNGEIDIVEGVNFQSEAKTALHTTQGCDMFDVPLGTMTGSWDTAVGIPDKKTGIPDMTFRQAKNCFVYDPHQWVRVLLEVLSRSMSQYRGPMSTSHTLIVQLKWRKVSLTPFQYYLLVFSSSVRSLVTAQSRMCGY